jgi:hypothetical protein
MMILELLTRLKNIMHNSKTLEESKLRNNAFTRNRKMPFASAISFLLDMRKTTLQTRLNLFFGQTKEVEPISQQAFSKLRANFDHSPFETMVRELVQAEYSGRYELPLWHKLHVLAVDGSYAQLPITPLLAAEFGIRGGGNRPSAGISVLYDVLHGWALDPIITHTNMNERAECEKHIDFLWRELPHIAANSVILLDRGYPSLDLLKKLQDSRLKYLARCNSMFVSEIKAAPIGSSVVRLKNGISVRVIKFVLSSGETETLATNLFDISETEFPQLYALRWGIEVAYFRLKRELCVEKFSGKTPNSVRQDFWASMVLLNSVAVFQREADAAVLKRQEHSSKPVKHVNRARTSDLIITLRDRFIFAGLCGHPILADAEMKTVIKTISRSVSSVRPGRSFQRHPAPCQRCDSNLKSHL